MRHALALLCLCASLPAAAGVITYVHNEPTAAAPCPTARCDALGYPVPLPVDSQTAVDGFRSYASLHARLQDLALGSGDIERRTLGQTRAGRDIHAYVLGDNDDVTAEGF